MKGPMKFIALFFALALMIVSPALAQDTPNPLCNGLVEADCAVLTAPGEEATSFSIPAWSIDFTLTSAEGTTAFSANGSGEFVAPTGDSTEGLLVHLFVDEATTTAPDGSETGALEVLVLDDMVYVMSEGTWYGGTMEEAGLSFDPSSMTGGTGDFDLSGLTADFSTSITTTRGTDAEVGGAPVAVFSTAINLAQFTTAIMADPAVAAAIPPDQAQNVQMIGMLVPMLLGNTTLTIEQSIGVDDGFIHQLVVDMPFDLDLSMMEMGQVSGGFNFSAEVADFNSTFTATAPESFEPLDSLGATTGM